MRFDQASDLRIFITMLLDGFGFLFIELREL